MKHENSVEFVRQEIIRLCHSALDSRTLRVELLQHLQTVIPSDYVFFSTTDPATQLFTSGVLKDTTPSVLAQFLENEFLLDDFNKFSDMLRRQQSVGVLSEQTQAKLERSQRYRDILAPMRLGDEMRAIFVTNAACWGTLCLHREQSVTVYSPTEAGFLAQLTPHIADALRKALLLEAAATAKLPDGPGVLILAQEDLSIVAMNTNAEFILTELIQLEDGDKQALPIQVRSVVAGLQAIEHGIATSDFIPKVRLRTRSGQWLVLYASWLKGQSDQQQISVIFEIAQPMEIAPLIMQVYNLTKREGEVTQCILRGWSTNEISIRLHISRHTVQDHLKAIFEKVDVSSRRELAARIFTQQYQPHFLLGDSLEESGYYR